MTSMKTELAALPNELGALRARTAVGLEPDTQLIVKCQSAEKKRDELRSLLVESEKQMATAQREVIATTINISPIRDDDEFMLKTEDALLLKQCEEELLADMKDTTAQGTRRDEETDC